jgi:hypothetical protein
VGYGTGVLARYGNEAAGVIVYAPLISAIAERALADLVRDNVVCLPSCVKSSAA